MGRNNSALKVGVVFYVMAFIFLFLSDLLALLTINPLFIIRDFIYAIPFFVMGYATKKID